MNKNKMLLLLVSMVVIVSAETFVQNSQRNRIMREPLIVSHSPSALPQQVVESPEE